MIRVIGVFTLVWVMGLAGDAEACSCPGSTPCAAFGQATAVFAGRVESVSSPAGASSDPEVRFAVIEGFHGVSGRTVSVVASGGFCRYRFKPGREYFVYASTSDETGRLTVTVCSRTLLLESAGADLAYARASRATGSASTHVTGRIAVDRVPGLADQPSIEGTRVVLEREGPSTSSGQGTRVEAIPDRSGRFSIEGLTPGVYTARLETPRTLSGQVWPDRIEVMPGHGCTVLNGSVAFDGRIRGRIVDHTGASVPGLTVELVGRTRRGTLTDAEPRRAVTNGSGEYELIRVPPGDYLLGFNTSHDAERAGLPRLFLPGVDQIGTARRLRIAGGQSLALDNFVIPARVMAMRIWGVVIDADGRPAPNARVFLKGPSAIDYVLAEPVPADASGRFAMTVFPSAQYRLFAEGTRNDGGSRVDVTDELTLVPSADMPPLRLVLRRRY